MRHDTSSSHSEPSARRFGIMIIGIACLFVPQTFGNWVVKDITAQNQKELDTKVEVSIEPMETVTNALAEVVGTITNKTLHVIITVPHSGSLKRFSHALLQIRTDETNLLRVQPLPTSRYAWLSRYGFAIDAELAKLAEVRLILDYDEDAKINEFVVRLKDFLK